MIRRRLAIFVLAIAFVLPVSASAQTPASEEYRSYLLELIELLQQQLETLQTELELQTSGPVTPVENTEDNFDSFLITDLDDIEARYVISDVSQVERISNRTHREYFMRFFEIVPDEYDRYFIDLLVFEERGNEFDGYVETVPPYRDDTWRIGINESMFEFRTTSNIVEELFVHEFAHILSYDAIPGRVQPRDASCHEYYDDFGCPPENSYLVDFQNTYWTQDNLDELVELDDEDDTIWSDRELREEFVSDYAGTNPAEDFAESFTFFVLENEAEGDTLADEKINYFYDFPELVLIREDIRNNL